MNLILICGKSGVGKSTFAKAFAKKLGFKYVDVDKIAHNMYKNKRLFDKIFALFGSDILDKNGIFDRKKLGKIIFENSNTQKVLKFNEITKNYIESKMEKIFKKSNCVADWLLFPLSKFWTYNCVKILIKSKDNLRFKNILIRDNISLEYLKSRDKINFDFQEKEFDFVISNNYDNTFLDNIDMIYDKICDLPKLYIYGTQSPFAKEDNACPSYLFTYKNTHILLDCGSGSHRFFDKKYLPNLKIIISHLHRDHYNDIFNYQYTSFVFDRQNRPQNFVDVYLPKNPKSIYLDIKNEKNAKCRYFDIDENLQYKINDCLVEFCRIEHSKDVDAFAIKITANNKVFVYTGDVSFASCEKLVKFAKNADMLLCESSLIVQNNFPKICSHLTAFQAGEIASLAGVKRLVLTHFWPETRLEDYLIEAKLKFKNTFVANIKDKFMI